MPLVHEAAALLATEAVNYAGHVDPAHIFRSAADVIVCDGFTGNVVIKSAEATAEFAFSELRYEVERRPLAKLAALAMRPALRAMRRRIDYAEIGATPLLGLKGLVLIGHGRSRAPAVTNGLGSGRPSGPGAAGADDRIRAGSDDGLAPLVDRRPGGHIVWAALMGSCGAAAIRNVWRCPRQ